MSYAYTHAVYAFKLVWPERLCYDWGFRWGSAVSVRDTGGGGLGTGIVGADVAVNPPRPLLSRDAARPDCYSYIYRERGKTRSISAVGQRAPRGICMER